MAADLRCYLQGEPVTAAAPTFAYLARKIYQRHRTICLTAATAAFLLVVSSLVSLSWAISNGRLHGLAQQRASELRDKTEQLEQLNSQLKQANNEARAAVQKLSALAIKKKKQAAMERATTKAVLQGVSDSFTGNDSDTDPGRSVTAGELPKQIQALVRNLKSSDAETDQFFSPEKLAEFSEMLTEEYRKEFGDQHWVVAESLLKSFSALSQLTPVDWSKIESRAREANSILEKAKRVPNRTFLQLRTSCWLARSLHGQDRTREAAGLKQSCQTKIADAKLSKSERDRLFELLTFEN